MTYTLLTREAPTPAERRQIRKAGGIVINLDTNWSRPGHPTIPMCVVPDDASPSLREAALAYAQGIADIYEERFGLKQKAFIRTRSQNKRGRPNTVHTEPYSVMDLRAVDYFNSPEGLKRHAELLHDTFGQVPGVVFSIPHDPTGRSGPRDFGAAGPKGNEIDFAQAVLAELAKLNT